jgi:hypothetical protein
MLMAACSRVISLKYSWIQILASAMHNLPANHAAANPAIELWLQSTRPASRRR